MRLLILIFITGITSCGSPTEGGAETVTGNLEANLDTTANAAPQETEETTTATDDDWKTYTSRNHLFQIKHPPDWTVPASNPDSQFEIINILPKETAEKQEVPIDIHAEAGISFISILPKGYGTEPPSGMHRNFEIYDHDLELSFGLIDSLSEAYFLEDESVWAYSLNPQTPPPSWKEYGFIFAQAAVEEFRAECSDAETGESKPVEECDPLAGDDFRRYGNVSRQKETLIKILESFEFVDSSDLPRPVSELIQIEIPLPEKEVRSPLKLKGKARGMWYFEGEFPVLLVDTNGEEIASGTAEAQGNWMTESWVPFTTELEFSAPIGERGYLVFSRANPSGLEENSREYRLPILFPPQ